METNPLDIIKKIVSDTNAINAHIANGGKLNELKGIKFAIPESIRGLGNVSNQSLKF